MSATPIADAIRRIEDRIGDERCWTRGAERRPLGNGTDAFCLWGAARAEVPDTAARIPLTDLLRDVIKGYSDEPHTSIAVFNDYDAADHAAVMDVLATALDVAEAEGL